MLSGGFLLLGGFLLPVAILIVSAARVRYRYDVKTEEIRFLVTLNVNLVYPFCLISKNVQTFIEVFQTGKRFSNLHL